jgi:choline dehydrogenase-like flavoprotein
VQAKYHAGKTLAKALQTGNVDILTQTVASKVIVDGLSGKVTEIEVKHYKDLITADQVETSKLKAKIFVLAANAIENARLLLASNLPSSSGLVGRNFMDHAYLLNWGLLPKNAGTMRGTNCTGGIVTLRDGSFRNRQAAFSMDIHNDGWGWAKGSPYTDLINLVDNGNYFGTDLREALVKQVSHQLLLAFMIEVLPNPSNRISVNPNYTDQLGNMKPVVSYTVPDYTLRGVAYARQFAKTIFQRTGATDYTEYDATDPGYVTFEGEGYVIKGGNHLAGTHIMGSSASNSVVNAEGKSWDHDNLYLAGGGNLPSIGTANITLTIAAFCYKSVQAIIKQI